MDISEFTILFIFLIASALFIILLMHLEDFLNPRAKESGMGNVAVESAERPLAGPRLVGFQYYLYAIVFVVIEALTVFLFLWGASIKQLGVAIFIGVSIGLIYLLLLVRYVLDRSNEVVD